jgi:hypothetical protein
MADTEYIEARLCAYVEGELDAQGRAEIEQHLADNPQHRQLLEQLVEQRQLVRDLPREKAPEDLYESFASQLERSVLLEGDQREHHEPMRISRRPQFFAAAAIVLLTITLAGVLLMVLPRGPARRPSEFAIAPAPTTAPMALNVIPATENVADKLASAEGPENKAVASKSAALDDTRAPMAKAFKRSDDVFAEGAGRQTLEQQSKSGAGQSQIFASDLDQRLSAINGARKPVVVTVSTNDPYHAQDQVRRYLVSNGISWQPLAEPMPPPVELGAGQNYEMSRAQQTQVRLKTARQKDELSQQPQQSQQRGASSGYAINSPATTAPALADSGGIVTNVAPPYGGALQQQQQQRAPGYGQQLFLARNLTPQQVAQLNACVAQIQSTAASSLNVQLPQQGPATGPVGALALSESAALRDVANRGHTTLRTTQPRDQEELAPGTAGGAAPSTAPSATLAPQDVIALDFMNIPNADSEQVKVQKITDSGEITLPGIGKMKAQGQTAQQLADAIAATYGAANLGVTDGKVSVRVVSGAAKPAEAIASIAREIGNEKKSEQPNAVATSAAPASTPAAVAVAAPSPAPAQPAMAPAAALREPATQEAGVDVVIVVQSDTPPEAEATTQPAAQVPAQTAPAAATSQNSP